LSGSDSFETAPSTSNSTTQLIPNPFLSDLFLPLSPPPLPTSTFFDLITIIASNDSFVSLSSHSCFLQQLATWPGREVVEIEFVWDDSSESATGEGGSERERKSRRKTAVGGNGGGGGEVDGKGKEGKTKKDSAWKGLENGRVVVVVGEKGSGRLITVEVLLQEIAT